MSSPALESKINRDSADFTKNTRTLVDLLTEIKNQEQQISEGGGAKAIESQHKKGRLTARERIAKLIDPNTTFFELGIYAAYEMYEDWGGAPAAGTITGLAHVSGRLVMIIANDATVKAGAFFPMTAKKVIRAQNIAIDNRIPTLYLVDSAGVFLPLQEDVFPDTDDFGRVFRNNAVMSAMGIPQIAAIMGMCVAGGAYLPVMCDQLLMTDGSGLFLAGPALVQAAIGQKVSAEELGGAEMHAQISGTVDFREPNDEACISAPPNSSAETFCPMAACTSAGPARKSPEPSVIKKLIAHHWEIRAARHAHSHNRGDLRNSHCGHHSIIAEHAPEIVGVRKHIFLQRKKNSR